MYDEFRRLYRSRTNAYPVKVDYDKLSTRIKVEVILGYRVMATERRSEDGVVYNVWVPSFYYNWVQQSADNRVRSNPHWHYEGWNIQVAERYWDVDTRPATALNCWKALGLV